jgi:hypothetical protein
MQTEKQVFAAPAGSGQDRPFWPCASKASRDRITKNSCSRIGANVLNPFTINANPQKPRSKTVKNVHLFNNCLADLPIRFFPAPKGVQTHRTPSSSTQKFKIRGQKRLKTLASLTIAPLPGSCAAPASLTRSSAQQLVARAGSESASIKSFVFKHGADMPLP